MSTDVAEWYACALMGIDYEDEIDEVVEALPYPEDEVVDPFEDVFFERLGE